MLLINAKLTDGANFFGETGNLLFFYGKIQALNIDISGYTGEIYDCRGGFLAPGFIDVHSHSDVSILSSEDCISKICGGFTSEIVGNCGLSVFPASDLNIENLQRIYQRYQVEINWKNYQEYKLCLENSPASGRIFSLTGHNTLHAAWCSYGNQAADAGKIAGMVRSLEESFEAGSLGLSLGLLYAPGRFASDFELKKLFECTAKHGKIVAVHLKSEGDFLVESLLEMVELARKTQLEHLHISHLKTSGEENFHKLAEVFDLIEKVNEKFRLQITFDRYPYIESMTQLSVMGPDKYLKMPDADIMATLQDKAAAAELLDYFRCMDKSRFETVILVDSKIAEYRQYAGCSVAEIARQSGISAPEILTELIRDDAVNSMAAFNRMSDGNMKKIIAHPQCMCGTDESARPLGYRLGRSHPRNFGTSAKFIKILLDAGLSMGEIVRKMSYLPAQIFKLDKLGELKAGYRADLVLIEPEKLASEADFKQPHRISSGIKVISCKGGKNEKLS